MNLGEKERVLFFFFLVDEENAVSVLLPAIHPQVEWSKYIHYQQESKLVRQERSKGVFDTKKTFYRDFTFCTLQQENLFCKLYYRS